MTASALWTIDAMANAMGAARQGHLPASISGLSIDSRSIGSGEVFFAIRGERRDGHEFVPAALSAKAALAVVAVDRRGEFPGDAPLLIVPDVLVAFHWGVPLSLARCPSSARYAIFEMGMNHQGEIAPLSRLVRPDVAIITTIAPVHLEFLGSLANIADAKAEIFVGVPPDGAAVINRDIGQFAQLKARAQQVGITRVISFGEHAEADARLIKCALHARCSTVEAEIFGTQFSYKIGAPGRHLIINSLAVLAATELVGADLALAALALAELRAASGRGAPIEIELPGGPALVLDESYNANPASVEAALAVLGRSPVGPRGRRVAVLGDMLELGPNGPDLHRGLADAVIADGIDLVFCCGPLMEALWQALPAGRRGGARRLCRERSRA